jgi:hypothetical protein
MKVSSTHKFVSVFAAAVVCVLLSCNTQANSRDTTLRGMRDALVETKGKSDGPLLLYAVLQTTDNNWVNISQPAATPVATPKTRVAEMKELVEVVASGLTLLAIIVGGTWSYLLFIRTRQKYPSANISQDITYRRITADKVWVRVIVTLQNTGKVLLSLVSGLAWIQQVLPLDDELREKIENSEDLFGEKESYIRWTLCEETKLNWEKGEHEIEPSETDQVYFDFIVDSELRTILIYTYFSNVKKFKRSKSLGWQIAKVYDLNPDVEKNLNKENDHASSPSAGDAAKETSTSPSQTAGETETEAETETGQKEIDLTGPS